MRRLPIAVLTLSLLACEARETGSAAAVPAGEAHVNPLLGGWTATRVDFRGLPPQGDPGIRLTFTEAEALWMVETPGGPEVLTGAYQVDLTSQPPRIDIADPFGEDPTKRKQGLFRIEGDVLTMALGDHRPASFEEGVMASITLAREASAR